MVNWLLGMTHVAYDLHLIQKCRLFGVKAKPDKLITCMFMYAKTRVSVHVIIKQSRGEITSMK